MPSGRSRAVRPAFAAVAGALFVLLHSSSFHALDEVRALWVVRTTMTSPSAIAAMVSQSKAAGFNTLLVQIRGRGDAYYRDAREPRPPAFEADPSFDPLATAIERAHAAGIQVHAWINVNLVSSATELPPSRSHVIYRHPEWLMVPRILHKDLAGLDPASPEYLDRLARSLRQRNDVEGLYVSPIAREAADYVVDIVRDIARRYAIDGVHFDYIRYPAEDFDYSGPSLAAFRHSVAADLPAADRERLDRRLADDPLVYTAAFPERWRAFRAEAVTSLLARLRQTVRTVRPNAKISAAVGPDADDAANNRFQDWRDWLRQGLLDVVCPMAYTTNPATFAEQIAAARDIAGSRPVWAGIGAYRLPASQIADNVQTARRLGAAGVVLFSYDSLAEPSNGPDYLAEVGRTAFATH
jgi:uncharacterized lipoprotein YddW (UPF0748 family)